MLDLAASGLEANTLLNQRVANGGPGRTRTCNQTVMSGENAQRLPEIAGNSRRMEAVNSRSVHINLCATCAGTEKA